MEVESQLSAEGVKNFRQINLLSEVSRRIYDPALRHYYAKNWHNEAGLINCPALTAGNPLSATERERYSRQILFAGEGSQQRLKAAHVTVLGAGGVGSPCLYYLAGAGVGHIRVVDMDVIERSNLNRQILYTEADLGRMKAIAAQERLRAFNPDIKVDAIVTQVTPANAASLIEGEDFVIIAIDDMYVASAACAKVGIPFAVPAANTSTFSATLFISGAKGKTPCLECAFNANNNPRIEPNRSTGVFGFLPGVVGDLAALEAVKGILTLPRKEGSFTILDMWTWSTHTFAIAPRANCDICNGG